MSNLPLRILVLGNGAAGAEKQALAFASRLKRSFAEKEVQSLIEFSRVELRKGFQYVPARAQILLSRWVGNPWLGYSPPNPSSSDAFKHPHVVIGCGRSTVALCALLEPHFQQPHDRIFRIQIQHPRTSLRHFDAVVTPRHDWQPLRKPNRWNRCIDQRSTNHRNNSEAKYTAHRLPSGQVPSRLYLTHGTVYDSVWSDKQQKQQHVDQELAKWTHLDSGFVTKYLTNDSCSRVVVLVGGPCREYAFSPDHAHQMCQQLIEMVQTLHPNVTLLVTFSRRTPSQIQKLMRKELGQGIHKDHLFIWNGHGENPFEAFLGCANAIVTTPDSISMTTEAISTGTNVFVLGTQEIQGKFRWFHDQLLTSGLTNRFESLVASSSLATTTRSATNGAIQLEKELQQIVTTIAHQIIRENSV